MPNKIPDLRQGFFFADILGIDIQVCCRIKLVAAPDSHQTTSMGSRQTTSRKAHTGSGRTTLSKSLKTIHQRVGRINLNL
jgi:hypothetical protein